MATVLKNVRWGSLQGKIIIPYFLITLFVATVGVFVVTRLVTGSLQERLHNQLLDAGRVVAEEQVQYERRRLEVLRAIGNTRGVAEAVVAGNTQVLTESVPQIVANYEGVESAALLDRDGYTIFAWQQVTPAGEGRLLQEIEYNTLDGVRQVLAGESDLLGNRQVALMRMPHGPTIQTIGPIYRGDEVVGAVLVGSDLDPLVRELTETAVARVSLYDEAGKVLATTLGTPETLQAVVTTTDGSFRVTANTRDTLPVEYTTVVDRAAEQVPLQETDLFGQNYLIAFGDWRLRTESVGLFSVAIPSNFVASAAATSRNLLSLLFSLATVGVFTIGLILARRLTEPLNRLVQVTAAVAEGDLDQRTGIERQDEIGVLAHSFDVMAEKLDVNRQALIAERSNLEAILDSIADGVLVFDHQQRLASANPAASYFLEDTGHSVPEEQDEALFDKLDQAITEESRFQAGGRFFSGTVAPVRGPAEQQLGWVIVLRDVTREVETEQEKDNFITSISHELRTPLTSIKGYTDLLKVSAAPVLSEQHKKFISVLQDNANKLSEHVAKLIEMAEVHSGSLALQMQKTWLSAILQTELERWEQRIKEKGLCFSYDIEDKNLWIDADPDRLKWAFDNVLRNAYEYTKEGEITVRLYRQDGTAHLEVADTGIGISASDRPHIFKRFYRAQTEATFDVYGLGLGLFITHEIITAHGGSVDLQSKLGEGSTFYVNLPLQAAAKNEGQE